MNKKVFRVLGYIFCGVLICLCILLVISASVFGARKTVEVFGANIYVVERDDIPTAPKGSAVLVKKGSCADLEVGNLVMYIGSDAGAPALGYVRELNARDGVYYVTVEHNEATYEFPESQLVGRADFSSKFLGGVIGFVKTPLGIMLVAVLPCAALILYDIIRAAAANRPGPEVVPTVINGDEEAPHSDIKLSVDTDGKARYTKDRSLKPLPKDNDILFSYSGKQRGTKQQAPKNERPIIPLTDKNPHASSPNMPKAPKKEASVKTEKTGKVFDVRIPAEEPAVEPRTSPRTSTKTATVQIDRPSEKTAEIQPVGEKKTNRDAFFAQPAVGRQAPPQIGSQRRANPPSAPAEPAQPARPKIEKGAGKRSTQILASKSFDDLLSDDDEKDYPQSKRDRALDDILSGLSRKNN